MEGKSYTYDPDKEERERRRVFWMKMLAGAAILTAGITFTVVSAKTARKEALLEGIDQGKTWAYQDVKIKLTEGLSQKYPFKIHEIGFEFIPTNTGETITKALIAPLKKKEVRRDGKH